MTLPNRLRILAGGAQERETDNKLTLLVILCQQTYYILYATPSDLLPLVAAPLLTARFLRTPYLEQAADWQNSTIRRLTSAGSSWGSQ